MKRITVKEIFACPEAFADKEVTVAGWAKTIRASNAFGFIELNDGSTFSRIQVVFEADKLQNYTEIAKQNVGAALIVRGTLVLTPQAKQPFEIKAAEVTVEGASTPDFPMQKKKTSLEFLRTIPHLRPRANIYTAVFRVRSAPLPALPSALLSLRFPVRFPLPCCFLHSYSVLGFTRSLKTIHLQED